MPSGNLAIWQSGTWRCYRQANAAHFQLAAVAAELPYADLLAAMFFAVDSCILDTAQQTEVPDYQTAVTSWARVM